MKMMSAVAVLTVAASCLSTAVTAQTLTPEEILRMVDERVDELGPYEALLNDPDPERSLAALQIMMGSGDATLRRLALEFGIQASDTTVRHAALSAFFATGPVLTVEFDGTAVTDSDYLSTIRSRLDATLGPDGVAYRPRKVGAFDEEQSCFIYHGSSNCYISVSNSGIALSSTNYSAFGQLELDGVVRGVASLDRVSDPVPFSIRIIE